MSNPDTPATHARATSPVPAARYMGWESKTGSLQPGLFGDLIAVRGDPLADVTRLQEVAVVIKGGLAFKLPVQ